MADIRICRFEPSFASEAAAMWRLSKEKAIGQKEIHSFESHIHFLNHILQQDYEIYLALENERVVGIVVFNSAELNQLYVANGHQGKGIGEALLNLAKEHSGGSLFLYTFERNKNAQRFYEKHGFAEVGRGYENEEKLPDIKYEWRRFEVKSS
ncbi:GNAT family N-acetyltransferase [Planomicrobium sp. Y74]|uniref:GNAT family N-acetyltransferase n=1 Tax=Planomicrobium sp. Y74 TaxID=2478977 RepID=UPI000EF475E5|nr:GNAT family N-acetyltransferase [Planomicrobium sp. Y74]RLQ91368.1 GNAT family N-acetyltransferase [Planomicrobium sp. Y74]